MKMVFGKNNIFFKQIAIWIIPSILVGFFLFSFVATVKTRQILIDAHQELIEARAHSIMDIIDMDLADRQADQNILASHSAIVSAIQASQHEKIFTFLRNLKKEKKVYSSIEIYSSDGKPLAFSSRAMFEHIGKDLDYSINRDWFQAALSGNAFRGKVRHSEQFDSEIIDFASPIRSSKTGKIIGILRSVYAWKHVLERIHQFHVKDEARGIKTRKYYVVDEKGKLIYGSSGKLVQKRLRERIPGHLLGKAENKDGRTKGLKWYALVAQSIQEITRPSVPIAATYILVTLLISLIVLAIILRFTKKISVKIGEDQFRLKLINRIARRAAEGWSQDAIVRFALGALTEGFPSFRIAYSEFISDDTLELKFSIKTGELRDVTGLTSFYKKDAGHFSRILKNEVSWIHINEKDPADKDIIEKLKSTGAKSLLNVPVFCSGNVIGTLGFSSKDFHRWSESEVRILKEVGELLGAIIEKYREQKARKEAEKKLIEQQSQLVAASKMSALGEMASGIAHEVNNPLAIIDGYANRLERLVKEGKLDDQNVLGQAQKIQKMTERISKIVKGLKTFARDGTKADFEILPFSKIIEDTLELCHARMKSKGIDLRTSGELDIEITCQPVQISQVLLNLLNNATDAIEKLEDRWIQIEVNKTGEFVRIAITDSGFGIPPEIADRLLEPFFTTKPVGKGTGLGLSVSKGIVEKHHGKFFLDKSTKNTRFVIELPVNLERELAAA